MHLPASALKMVGCLQIFVALVLFFGTIWFFLWLQLLYNGKRHLNSKPYPEYKLRNLAIRLQVCSPPAFDETRGSSPKEPSCWCLSQVYCMAVLDMLHLPSAKCEAAQPCESSILCSSSRPEIPSQSSSSCGALVTAAMPKSLQHGEAGWQSYPVRKILMCLLNIWTGVCLKTRLCERPCHLLLLPASLGHLPSPT